MTIPHGADGLPQQIDMPRQQVVPLPLQQVHGEEVSPAWMPGSTVIRHEASIEAIGIRRNALRLLRPTRLC
ncbi:MAG: hypothetical protein K8F27_09315 [Sulfuricellaceae bacterium]|nr:hypothetical protein [Sulfuricellaceae bacterium]